MSTATKLSYLNETKSQLKDMINYGLDDNNKITSSTTFRNYVTSIFNAFLEALRTPDTLFTNLPKKSGTGANITLNDTANAPMRITLGSRELSQATTTGANLQKFSPRTSSNTYNYVCDDKGQVTITGTVSDTVGLSYNLSSNYMTLTTGTYKMKVIGNATGVIFTANNAKAIIGGLDSNQEATVSVTENISNFQIFQYLSTGITYNCNYYITLASETTATTERYTGGIVWIFRQQTRLFGVR